MMSVYEYATDVNLSVNEILNLCVKLGISVNNEDDMLDDDGIIMLDSEIANLEETSEVIDICEETFSAEQPTTQNKLVIISSNAMLFFIFITG